MINLDSVKAADTANEERANPRMNGSDDQIQWTFRSSQNTSTVAVRHSEMAKGALQSDTQPSLKRATFVENALENLDEIRKDFGRSIGAKNDVW